MKQDSWLSGLLEERRDGDPGQGTPMCPDLPVGPQGNPGSRLFSASQPVCPSQRQAWQIFAVILPSIPVTHRSLAWTLGLLGSDGHVPSLIP